MLDPIELYKYVINPTLNFLGLQSRSASLLVLGTGLAESGLKHLSQSGSGIEPGPGLGLFQMERATHDDIWQNYLAYRPDLRAKVQLLAAATPEKHLQLISNLGYSIALCRLQYARVSAPLPKCENLAELDLNALAEYWKRYYNTPGGKGTVSHFLENSDILKRLEEF